MKRRNLALVLSAFFIIISLLSFASAECVLNSKLINQDPYPAVPGDYVTLVFQLEGVENYECGQVYFELMQNYPLRFDPGTSPNVTIQGGTFVRDKVSYLRIPYKVRIDSGALDGNNKIDVRYRHSGSASDAYSANSFNLSVEDVRTTFEVYVKNYDPSTGKITFEVLNTGKSDVEALTLEVKNQESIALRGPSTKIIGSLDSNDFTTTDFEAIAKKGQIDFTIYYTDAIDVRRSFNSSIEFDPQPFIDKQNSEQTTPWTLYIIILVIVVGAIYYFYRRHKKKQEKKKKHLHN